MVVGGDKKLCAKIMSYFPIPTTDIFHKASGNFAVAKGKDDATKSNVRTSC